jgi:uncharacterized heparinase superfamily protein
MDFQRADARRPGETALTIAPGEAAHVWYLAAAHLWRRFSGRLRAGFIFRWRFTGFAPERLLIAPPDLRIADPQVAEEFYAGRFAFEGHVVETGGFSPFAVQAPNRQWEAALNGFRWLRHLRAADTDIAAANARALVFDWIDTHGKTLRGVAWSPDVTARRVIAWMQHSNLVLAGASLPTYRRFLRSLAFQIRYLRTMAITIEDDEERLRARIALAFASLTLPVSPGTFRAARHNLDDELSEQILPDGGHISRNPAVLLELLTDLLPLRQTYAAGADGPPQALIDSVERMLPALRFFRHQDGSLALFNGTGATMPDRIMAVLRHDETGGSPPSNAPHSGFARLAGGNTTVIADTGPPPPATASRDAHAGCLSFEMSSGRHRYIVNTGVDLFGPRDFRQLSRSTAAHSTATINDTSSCRFSSGRGIAGLSGTPIIAGPQRIDVQRLDEGGRQGFVARHDGYLRIFGVYHERHLSLSEGGSLIEGVDRFYGTGQRAIQDGRSDTVAVRFHLHPAVRIGTEGGFISLNAGRDDVWVFSSDDVAPAIEDSIYFAGLQGPVTTRQIVLAFKAAEAGEVRWRLTRTRLGA